MPKQTIRNISRVTVTFYDKSLDDIVSLRSGHQTEADLSKEERVNLVSAGKIRVVEDNEEENEEEETEDQEDSELIQDVEGEEDLFNNGSEDDSDSLYDDIADYTIDEIEEKVNSGEWDADQVLSDEEDREDPRTTLTDWLKAITS